MEAENCRSAMQIASELRRVVKLGSSLGDRAENPGHGNTTAGEEHGEGSGAHDSRDREFPGVPPTLSQVPNPQLSISLNLCFTIKSSAYLISMQMNPSWRDAARQDMIRGRRRDAASRDFTCPLSRVLEQERN